MVLLNLLIIIFIILYPIIPFHQPFIYIQVFLIYFNDDFWVRMVVYDQHQLYFQLLLTTIIDVQIIQIIMHIL